MEDTNCLFCKIIAGEIPSSMVYEDELLVAFKDINPKANVHILIVPRKHIADNNAYSASEDAEIAARLFEVAPKIAKEQGIFESGYRLVMNTGKDGRQEIQHLHMHLLGGNLLSV